MPYSALYVPTGNIVSIQDVMPEPRVHAKPGDYLCHLSNCEDRLIVVAGQMRRAHFRHHSGVCGCPYLDDDQRGESDEHLAGKERIAAMRLGEIQSNGGEASVTFERDFPAIRRIADVCFEWPDGWLEVHEIQVSNIAPAEVRARTEAYRSQGADVAWWFCAARGARHFDAETAAAELGALGGSLVQDLGRA